MWEISAAAAEPLVKVPELSENSGLVQVLEFRAFSCLGFGVLAIGL